MSSIKTDEVDASSSLASSEDDGVAMCYLCLGGGVDDEDGQPLRRDCACRGTDAGFVHFSCLTEYASSQSKQARTINEFRDPWETCPGCHQCYQNELGIDIATKFVSFVRRQYPRDTRMQLETLHVKLRALYSMFDVLQPVQKRELGVTANVLLSLIDRIMKEISRPLPRRYSEFEASAYYTHGQIALKEGTDESARRAVVHFENQLKVNEAVGDNEGIATAKGNIAYAKYFFEDGNTDELLTTYQELYELRVAELGDEHEHTIKSGKNYAIRLQKVDRGDEARELLTKLLATSRQVLGPHHNTTKEVESTQQHANTQG